LNSEEFGVENYGAMPIPYGVEESESSYDQLGGTISALGGWHMGVNANSEKKDAAIQFIEAAMSDMAQLHMFEIQGWQPAKPDLLESDQARNAGNLGNYVDTFRVCAEGNLISRPITPYWTEEFEFYANSVGESLRQEKSSQQALNDLAQRIEDYEDSV
jgi:ABC-type glycerol-3-phosphate transport system substrate-binding protein